MKPAPFDYVRPGSVTEAIGALTAAGDEARIIAGGQSLLPLLALRLARPTVLVDLAAIEGLAAIDRTVSGAVRCGAMTTHTALTRQTHHPLLAEAARWIGHAAIRTRGTVGGSLAHADPAAELPLVACATAASLEIEGPRGRRTVGADDFFRGPFDTQLAENEVLIAIDLPVPDRWGFAEFARRHGDFGLVTVVAAEFAGHWRIVVGGVSGTPHRATEAEAELSAADWDGSTATTAVAAATAAVVGVDPVDDVHATGDYRRALTEHLTLRALNSAFARSAETTRTT